MENYPKIGIRIGNNRNTNNVFSNNIQHMEKIRKLADTFGYNLEQHNGQRIFGPPMNWNDPEPAIKSEVFIGHIPKGIFEDTLIPLFSNYGTIYKFRLMMDFSGENRGFGFCLYSSELSATLASVRLDNFEIIPGKKIGVMGTEENNSLIISDVPFRHNIKEMLSRHTTGIVDIKYQDNLGGHINLLVRYVDHRSSALARRFLMNNASNLFNTSRVIMVDWAKRSTRLQAYLSNKHFKRLDTGDDTHNVTEVNNNDITTDNNVNNYNQILNINQVNLVNTPQTFHNEVPDFNLLNNGGISGFKNNIPITNFVPIPNFLEPFPNAGIGYDLVSNYPPFIRDNLLSHLQNQTNEFPMSLKQYRRNPRDFDRDSLESSPRSCDESL